MNPLTPAVAALILAGGASSRMGQDKALLKLNGVPLLRQTYEVAQQCCNPVFVITPWRDRYQPILPAHSQWVQETPLPGESFPHGPLVGFAQGLAHLQTEVVQADWVLLLACDLPKLNEAAIAPWFLQLAAIESGAIALLPNHPKGWEPLCGFYRRRCLPGLMAFIDGGGRSFQGWLRGQWVEELLVSQPEILFNCNTPDDLENAQVSGFFE